MKKSNIRVISNIYPVVIKTIPNFLDGETRETIPEQENRNYFQEISDRKDLKTACDSCSCQCDSCMEIKDRSERPWGRVRIDGSLIDICKCQRTLCSLFYSECRTDLEEPNAK